MPRLTSVLDPLTTNQLLNPWTGVRRASNISHIIFFGLKLGKKGTPPDVDPDAQLDQAYSLGGRVMPSDLTEFLKAYNIADFTATSLSNGASTHTYLISYPGGAKVLRIYSDSLHQKHKGGIEQEIDFMRYLDTKGVPVPQLIPNTQGSYISEYTADDVTSYYVVMELAPGAHPTEYTSKLIEQMAHNQASIHIHGKAFAAGNRPYNRRFNPKVDWLIVAPKGFSHCDYDASNILVADDKLTCVLDFEGMRFVPLVSCLFFTLTKIYGAQKDHKGLTQYLAAYQQIRKLNRLERFIIHAAMASWFREPRLLMAW